MLRRTRANLLTKIQILTRKALFFPAQTASTSTPHTAPPHTFSGTKVQILTQEAGFLFLGAGGLYFDVAPAHTRCACASVTTGSGAEQRRPFRAFLGRRRVGGAQEQCKAYGACFWCVYVYVHAQTAILEILLKGNNLAIRLGCRQRSCSLNAGV